MHLSAATIRRSLASLAVIAVLFGAGAARADVIKVSKKAKVGSYLTDSKGMTLYTFKKDTAGKSDCTGECLEKWPAYHDAKIQVGGKLSAKEFGTITREDGKEQTTFKGKPLYYFAGDKKPGDTNGQGVRDLWVVAKP